ncbi:MAG: hypothetical protein JWM80_3093 [Cyanobacteria bacterium RYN_339]|nr:hypothetical protein [Cyanobacteria bacterium RYN_339]
MLKRALVLLTTVALTGCGTHVAQPASNILVDGSRFETLKAKTSVDPLVKKAVQDAAKKALQAIEAMEDAQVDPSRLNPALAAALANGQITADQVKLMALYGQLNGVFTSLASIIEGGKDDYTKGLVAQLDAMGKAVKKFETARKGMDDAEAFKLLADVVKSLKKGLQAIAK